MKSSIPKQYLPLGGKPIVLHSFSLLQTVPEINSSVVVTEKKQEHLFSKGSCLRFAQPGKRRQDSVWNALQVIPKETTHVLIHDGARPFVQFSCVKKLLEVGKNSAAAALAVPIKATIRKAVLGKPTLCLDRKTLWEMHTPQMIEIQVLKSGFSIAQKNNLTVTDDASLAELTGAFVKIVEGSEKNIKITTPFDYRLAQQLYAEAL